MRVQRQLKAAGVLSHCAVLHALYRQARGALCGELVQGTVTLWAAAAVAGGGWVLTAALLPALRRSHSTPLARPHRGARRKHAWR